MFEVAHKIQREQKRSKCFVISCILISLTICIYIIKPTSPTLAAFKLREIVSINQRSFDIVLSYYKEDTTFVTRFVRYLRNVTNIHTRRHRFIVYNKNPTINDQQLKQTLNVDIVKTLPNLGREGATYLSHIIDNYDQLADHTLFSQAGVEGITKTGLEDWFRDRLERQFSDRVGYMPLVVNSMISTYNCGIHPSGHFPRLPEFWAMLEQTMCPLDGQAVSDDDCRI